MALQNVEANITLDLYNHDTTPATVKAIQLDSQTRYVAAMLQSMGAEYGLDSGATVQLIVIRPDKVGVQITGETFTYGDEGAQFLGPYAELTQVALAVNGKMRGQFKITSGTQILRTEIFAISNGEALDASTDEWADEYDGYNLEEMATSIEANTADIATLEADVSQIKEDFTDISTNGANLFDKSKAHLNRAVNLSGSEYNANNFYCTDFIPIAPSTDYKINVGVGSASAYYTCLFYDTNKTFISGSFNSAVAAYTVTTPSNCAYMRVNGAITRIDTQMIALAGVNRFSDYQLIVDGRNETGVRIVSAKEIFYDKTSGLLTSASAISIITPDNAFNIGTSVNVGTAGGYLYWNKQSGVLYTSSANDASSDVYLLAILSNTREFEPHKHYCTIDSAFPIFKLDLPNNKLYVQVNGQPCYLIYNGCYYALSSGFSQEITLPNHCAIAYVPSSNAFEVISEFTNYALSKGIPLMTRYYTQITCRVDYETIICGDSYKRFVCYGDSLTWYDGNAFTWGEHEGETCVGFESYIRSELQARAVANRGESGKTTPQICGKILTATDLSNYDVLTIMGGDNDDRLEVSIGTVQPVGGTFDTTTVCGALQSAIEYALGQNPNLRIILMTEPMGWTYQSGTMDRVSELVPNAYRNVAKQYGLPLIDLWTASGINELTRETFYADPAPSDNQLYMYHPNNDGWVRCSKVIIKHLKAYI